MWAPRELPHTFVSVMSEPGVAVAEIARLAKLIADQPLPGGRGPLTPSDTELPRPGDQVIRRAATIMMVRAGFASLYGTSCAP